MALRLPPQLDSSAVPDALTCLTRGGVPPLDLWPFIVPSSGVLTVSGSQGVDRRLALVSAKALASGLYGLCVSAELVASSATIGAIIGPTAAGAAPTTPPVQIAGWDATNLRTLLTTSTGVLHVVLTAGSAAIGKLAANSGTDIGDVDVATMPQSARKAAGLIPAQVNHTATGNYITLATVTAGKKWTLLSAGVKDSGGAALADLEITDAAGTAVFISPQVGPAQYVWGDLLAGALRPGIVIPAGYLLKGRNTNTRDTTWELAFLEEDA